MEETKNKCQYCGKEMNRGLTMHERTCKQNPEYNKEKPAKEPEQKPLIITDVQPSLVDIEAEGELFPWFVDEMGNKKLEMYNFIGSHENIPCVLVMTGYGQLMPAYLFKGFIGMYPKYHEFPEAKQDEPIKQRELQNELNEPITAPQSEEKQSQVITQPGIHASQPEKKSIFAWPFGKKEKKEKVQSKMTNSELASQILNVSKAT